ncbi:hypothetical protein E3N88_06662 [Mikania micrantha]|uniref:Uncharacterized protein n=1 Tax=Mikania micrantha TaxID=192012 RepID=A0A5N6PQL3_9ASTR|nr:hypothetical protein E3N88_06662 [Mikania micrantha]
MVIFIAKSRIVIATLVMGVQEHKIDPERSVTPGLEGDPSLETSVIVSNTVDSSTGSKHFGVSSWRMTTRSMKMMDNSKHGFFLVNDISNLDKRTPKDSEILSGSENLRKSERRNVVSKLSGGCGKGSSKTASCSKEDTVLRMKLRRKQFDKNVDVVTPKDGKGISSKGKNKADDDLRDDIFITRQNMKGCRNEKKSRADIPQEKVVSEEQYESANILSLESFIGKKSRSGRIVLPPLEYWRNQKVVYDEDGQMCGVQEPK